MNISIASGAYPLQVNEDLYTLTESYMLLQPRKAPLSYVQSTNTQAKSSGTTFATNCLGWY